MAMRVRIRVKTQCTENSLFICKYIKIAAKYAASKKLEYKSIYMLGKVFTKGRRVLINGLCRN